MYVIDKKKTTLKQFLLGIVCRCRCSCSRVGVVCLVDLLRKLLQIVQELVDIELERVDDFLRFGFETLTTLFRDLMREKEKSKGEMEGRSN